VIAGIAFPIVLVLMHGWPGGMLTGLAVAAAALLVFTHRSNLARIAAGSEHRFERARVLARLLGGRRGHS
jgi:glycerol-3-phosphate acyltransferase PlsY